MIDHPPSVLENLETKKVSRRDFIKFCGLMAGVLALPISYREVIAQALSAATTRLPVVWIEFQGCTGDTESFSRAISRPDPIQAGKTDPGILDLLLDFISLEFTETLMAPSGFAAEKSLDDTISKYKGNYICVIEGAIPTGSNGIFCTMGGKTALSIAQNAITNAKAVVAMGSCAYNGGLPAAAPNPTGAKGVAGAFPSAPNLLALPGCPANVVNLVAALVYFLTFQRWPDRDTKNRPYFAYGSEIHENCERNHFFEADQFVQSWGDAGHRAGWCLFKMGCKGPATAHNCYKVLWNDGTSWPIGSGHGCVGCAADVFWDRAGGFYTPLPDD